MKNILTNHKSVYTLLLVIMIAFSTIFVGEMVFLNYRTSVFRLYDLIVYRVGEQSVHKIEKALDFGKDYDSFYGIQKYINNVKPLTSGAEVVCIDIDNKPLYSTMTSDDWEEKAAQLLSNSGFEKVAPDIIEEGKGKTAYGTKRILGLPVHSNGSVVGFFLLIYDTKEYSVTFNDTIKTMIILSVIALMVELLLLFSSLFVVADKVKKQFNDAQKAILSRALPVMIISGGVIGLGLMMINSYQRDYYNRIEESCEIVLKDMESIISEIIQSGVNLKKVKDLDDYVERNLEELEVIQSIRISDRVLEADSGDDTSDVMSFRIGREGHSELFIEAEISDSKIEKEMMGIGLVLLSSLIILIIFVFELFNFVELAGDKILSLSEKRRKKLSRDVSLGLRLTGFMCSTAEYMCVPYAAMMIRESESSIFGLPVGVTAALPLSMEGIAQIVGMVVWPGFVKKLSIKRVLWASTIIMALANVAAFLAGGHRAGAVILCRTVAGFAYAGFKQVSNYLITRTCEVNLSEAENDGHKPSQEKIETVNLERSEFLSQDNAGLLAGATCGAGLGAILSATVGYEVTFIFSAVLFFLYFAISIFLLPWEYLRGDTADETKKVSLKAVVTILKSPTVWRYIALYSIPLNVGALLCVTLIPGICQMNDISSIVLSFVYIANGIAGIYIGPMLVSRAKRYFGVNKSVAFAFVLTAVSLFILKLPPIIVMIIISGMILGFLDGFATPLVTDYFMEMDVVTNSVDESTALIFSSELSYVLLTFAPLIIELLLLPSIGGISPMYIGAGAYVLVAVLILFSKGKRA